MILFHLGGHSDAGKSRLMAALPSRGIYVPRAVLYTSRQPRDGEIHGVHYYFASKGAIAALPADRFFVGPVRRMLQAVDLVQLEDDLTSGENKLVLIEIFSDLWPKLLTELTYRPSIQHIEGGLRTVSVFLTAVDPDIVRALPDNAIRGRYVEGEVQRYLVWRGKDEPDQVAARAKSAVGEVLGALGLIPGQGSTYDLVLHSSPEGPDGHDDWTRSQQPIGRAGEVLETVVQLLAAGIPAERAE